MVLWMLGNWPSRQSVVTDHDARVDELLCVVALEEVRDDDGRIVDGPRLLNERRVRSLAGTRSTHEPDDLGRERHVLGPVLGLELAPDRVEDDDGILDLGDPMVFDSIKIDCDHILSMRFLLCACRTVEAST